ncbi:MAG: UTP--glucose-1-phosphate uridylyltransferase [Lachnospiraceae bacterium]|jgi:UDP-N-acetylglucosamine/UDP-N-acetylgalactosamine diphosphorylase|nr:UTP--glucose-1-phosphate uridylyltransferase [Lachnospiraceae bacterium]
MFTYEQAAEKLNRYGQGHVLKYYDGLSAEEKQALLSQIEATDFSMLHYAKERGNLGRRGVITPLGAMEVPEIEAHREEFEKAGLEEIRKGRVGAVLLAGGMGTRLGSDDPKCMYDIGITKHVYIMQRLIENLQEVVKKAGVSIPLFIMTSDKNDAKTRQFMKDMNCFGYDPSMITYFIQDMAPASDYEGRVYMESRGRIATSPNGNGGWFVSMAKTGVLKKVQEMGIEWLDAFAVDNVLQRICDPCFIGATITRNCACGAMVVRKAAPDEKVGAMCLEDGKPSIVEYYDMTPELMEARNEKGDPAYNFGVIMNYLFREKDLERIMNEQLPLHVVEKKIAHIDENGELIKPEAPNGCKYEQLVLDMIHELDSCLPYEVVREHAFAPIKNKTGIDSVESARELCRQNGIEL